MSRESSDDEHEHVSSSGDEGGSSSESGSGSESDSNESGSESEPEEEEKDHKPVHEEEVVLKETPPASPKIQSQQKKKKEEKPKKEKKSKKKEKSRAFQLLSEEERLAFSEKAAKHRQTHLPVYALEDTFVHYGLDGHHSFAIYLKPTADNLVAEEISLSSSPKKKEDVPNLVMEQYAVDTVVDDSNAEAHAKCDLQNKDEEGHVIPPEAVFVAAEKEIRETSPVGLLAHEAWKVHPYRYAVPWNLWVVKPLHQVQEDPTLKESTYTLKTDFPECTQQRELAQVLLMHAHKGESVAPFPVFRKDSEKDKDKANLLLPLHADLRQVRNATASTMRVNLASAVLSSVEDGPVRTLPVVPFPMDEEEDALEVPHNPVGFSDKQLPNATLFQANRDLLSSPEFARWANLSVAYVERKIQEGKKENKEDRRVYIKEMNQENFYKLLNGLGEKYIDAPKEGDATNLQVLFVKLNTYPTHIVQAIVQGYAHALIHQCALAGLPFHVRQETGHLIVPLEPFLDVVAHYCHYYDPLRLLIDQDTWHVQFRPHDVATLVQAKEGSPFSLALSATVKLLYLPIPEGWLSRRASLKDLQRRKDRALEDKVYWQHSAKILNNQYDALSLLAMGAQVAR